MFISLQACLNYYEQITKAVLGDEEESCRVRLVHVDKLFFGVKIIDC